MRKIFFIFLLLISVSLISVSTVAASDMADEVIGIENIDQANSDEVLGIDNLGQTNDDEVLGIDNLDQATADVAIGEIDAGNLAADDTDDNVVSAPVSRKSTSSKKLSASQPYAFKVLNQNIGTYTILNLYDDYAYYSDCDSDFEDGILIDHNIIIEGNGHTIDARGYSRIFKIVRNDIDVVIKNLNLINGWTRDIGGAAIFGNCTAINCTFNNNDFGYKGLGGAMYGGCAINCTFEDNNADNYESVFSKGGAMFNGTAIGCIFRKNGAAKGGAIANCTVVNCIFEENLSGNWGGAMLGGYAKNCTFIRNYAPMSGGGMDTEDAPLVAEDCTFIENKANVGAAFAKGTAIRCVFINNIAADCGASAIQWGNATNCIFNNDTVLETNILNA